MVRKAVPVGISDLLGSTRAFVTLLEEVAAERLRRESGRARITLAQLKLLNYVSRMRRHRVGDLAAILGVSNAAASKATDRLVRRRLIHRQVMPGDRRAVELSLTPRGAQLLADFASARRNLLHRDFRGAPLHQVRATVTLLDRLSARLLEHCQSLHPQCIRCGLDPREHCPLRAISGNRCFYHDSNGRWEPGKNKRLSRSHPLRPARKSTGRPAAPSNALVIPHNRALEPQPLSGGKSS
jgi:DNA-binding MarR family transcriptional regulator